MTYRSFPLGLTLLVILRLPAPGAPKPESPLARDVLIETGLEAGLVVHVGTSDGLLEVALARTGGFLVHGFTDAPSSVDRARAAIRAEGLYGLASVEHTRSLRRLPYADNLVNLLVADLDALGDNAPAREEILRTLAPRGVAYLKENGRWAKTVKPRPDGMGDWTHYDHGPDGNPVSKDTLVAPVTAVRWHVAPSISRAGSDAEAGLRLAGGRIVYALKDHGILGRQRRGAVNHLVCRDAYNGLLLWKIPIAREKYTPYRHELILTKDRIYTMLEATGPMVALDAGTGRKALSFSEGVQVEPLETNRQRKEAREKRHLVARLCEGRLLQAYRSTICALDAGTGRRLWTFHDSGKSYVPLLVTTKGRVFAVVGSEPTIPMRGTVAVKAACIVALDLETGEELWRNHDIAGNYVVRLVHHEGCLPVACFPGSDRKGREGDTPMTGYGHKFAVVNIDAGSGRTLWSQREQKSVGGHYAITFARDGRAYVACERYIGYDLETGEFDAGVAQRTFVNACAETRATPEYILYGMSFADREGRFSPRAVARSTCDTGVFPANGLVYCSPPLCSCLDVLAGYLATAADPPPEPWPDEDRLVAGAAASRKTEGAVTSPTDWPIFLGGPGRGCASTGEVGDTLELVWRVAVGTHPEGNVPIDWTDAEVPSGPVTAPTVASGKVFVAATHRHTVQARDSETGSILWSFTADGRIDSPPTLYEGLCIFGSRDGRVYALRASDGKLCWRFLAGLGEKRIVSGGQLESPWPVPGSVVIHGARLYFTAGRHSAIDGGILLYKLEPLTGEMLWRARIASGVVEDAPSKEIPVYSNHGKVGRYYPRVAHLLVSSGKKLHHFMETLEESYDRDALVELHASNGRWNRVDPKDMTWLRSNMMGFVSRRRESIGRFDHEGIRYADVTGDAIVVSQDALYVVDGQQPGGRGKFGRLTRVPLGPGGRVGEAANWKAQIRHQKEKRELGNFEVSAMILVGEKLLLAGHVREKPGSALHAYSAGDGTKLGQWTLPARPLRNGMAAARGRLYIALEDGTLACFGSPGGTR